MNATATPAKASRPRVYEQLAGPVPLRQVPIHAGVWLLAPTLGPLLVIGVVALIFFIKN